MDTSSGLIEAVFTELVWVLGGGAIGLVAAVATLVLMLGRRPVPPVLGGAGVGVVAVAALCGGYGGLWNPDLYTGALAAGMIHLVAGLAVLPLAGLMLVGTAAIGLRDRPRHSGLPMVVGLLVICTVVGALVEGSLGGNMRFGVVRAVLLGGFGLLTVCSTFSAADDAQDAVVVAGVSFALVTAVLESAERGMASSMALFQTVRLVEPGLRSEAIEKMLALVAPGAPGAWIAVGSATLVGLCTLGWTLRSRGFQGGTAAALLWLAIAPAVLLLGIPGIEAMKAAALAP